jgi:D-glycero-D-manno-heptose 1,7-bisphosphate phosphatase
MVAGRTPAVFLDRDGVLNQAVVVDGRPHPPATADEVVIIDGVAEACAHLRAEGFALVCITNQPDIARGTTSTDTVAAINERVRSALDLDAVATCPHDDGDECACRKPAPGLILDTAASRGLDLGSSVVVGDRWKDVEAGHRAGCATVFIDHGYAEARPERPDAVATSLLEAVPVIISLSRRNAGVPME